MPNIKALQAKYKSCISNGSKVKTNVKVVQATNKPTNGRQKQYVPAIATGDIKTFFSIYISFALLY